MVSCYCRTSGDPELQGSGAYNSVTAAQAGIQNFKAFDKTGLLLAEEWPVAPFG